MTYADARVLVTGADGFIGSHLTEALVHEGAYVTALSAYNSFDANGWLDELPEAIRSKLRIVRGDIRDSSFVRRLLADQQIVFHLAALIAIPYSYVAAESYVATNVLGTLHVLEAARDHGIERIVHTSTSEVYGSAITRPIRESHPLQGQSPYAASKIGADAMAEAFARSFDLPVAILRPFNTFGPRQSERAVIPSIVRQALDPACEAIRVGDLTPVRDVTFVTDTAAAFLAIGRSPAIEFGTPYNAGSGHGLTIAELAELIVSLTGCSKPLVSDGERMRPPRSEVSALLADVTRFHQATGWAPKVDLLPGLERCIDWWRGRFRSGAVRAPSSYAT